MKPQETIRDLAMRELTEEERRAVGGGLNPQPLPPRAPRFN